MITLAAVTGALGFVVENLPAFRALGVDIGDVFTKSRAVITGDTVVSTPEERAAAMVVVEELEAKRDTRLEELRLEEQGSSAS